VLPEILDLEVTKVYRAFKAKKVKKETRGMQVILVQWVQKVCKAS
jgi:hypothetical protein